MTLLASILSIVAGLVHVGIFLMESLWWRRPEVWRAFKLPDQQSADDAAFFAFNQGFYNLFLGLGAIVGPIYLLAGYGTVGWTLYLYSCGSMVAAATVLRLRGGSTFTRPAVIQACMPVLALAFAVPSLLS